MPSLMFNMAQKWRLTLGLCAGGEKVFRQLDQLMMKIEIKIDDLLTAGSYFPSPNKCPVKLKLLSHGFQLTSRAKKLAVPQAF